MPVFVKGYTTEKGKRVRSYSRKTKAVRLQGIMDRYQRASVKMNKLPGPSTGIYGTGHSRLDRMYSITSSQMRRGLKVLKSKKYGKKALIALQKARKSYPY